MTASEISAMFEQMLDTEYEDYLDALLSLQNFRIQCNLAGMRGKYNATVVGNRVVPVKK